MTATKPLDGIVVADFTSMVAGPWCTRLLADCGANVIKVEPQGIGDIMRYAPPLHDGSSRVFAHYNCGKQSVALDLKSDEGRATALALVKRADVVVENYRPGIMASFGLDYNSVKSLNSSVVYCSISGFGQTGALAGKAAYAPIIHAYSGLDHVFKTAQGDKGGPPNCGVMIADVLAATYAFGAVQTALLHRERHGVGSYVDVSLLDSAMTLVAQQYQEAQSDTAIKSLVFTPLKTSDGHVTVPLVSVKTYQGAYRVIGKLDWLDTPKFNTLSGIGEHRSEIIAALSEWTAQRSSQECEIAFDGEGVPCGVYRSPAEQLTNPELRERGTFTDLTDSEGAYSVLNPPFQLSSSKCIASSSVAILGADNGAVSDFLRDGSG